MAESDRSSRNRTLIAILVFIAVTTPLSWWWIEGGNAVYAKGFEAVARPIYQMLGVERAFFGPRLRYMNYIPFVGLVLATPGLGISRRLRGMAVGVIVIFVSHILFNLTATRENGFKLNEAIAGLSDALPFVLWALIARETLVRLGVRAFGMQPLPLNATHSEGTVAPSPDESLTTEETDEDG